MEATHQIDGWKVRITRKEGLMRFFGEAKHEANNKYEWADANDLRDVLLRLADAMRVDGGRLLSKFGIEP